MAYNYNYNNSYPEGPQVNAGYPNYPPVYPPTYNGGYQYNAPQYPAEQGPQYQQQQSPVQVQMPNKVPTQVPRPTGPKQSPKNPRSNNLVVWPEFVTRGTHANWEFRRKQRYAAINNIFVNDKKRIHVTPKRYRRRKMNIKDAQTGAKICKIELKMSVHRQCQVKDMSGNLLFVTRCKKVLQFKKRFEVFLMHINPDFKNREPDLIVEGGVRKAKKFKIKTRNERVLATLQRHKKKGMDRFRGKTSYEMQIQPESDCLLMAILLLILDETFEKQSQSSSASGGGGGGGGDGGVCIGGGDCGGGGC